jgi:hypothetical protein
MLHLPLVVLTDPQLRLGVRRVQRRGEGWGAPGFVNTRARAGTSIHKGIPGATAAVTAARRSRSTASR